MHRHGQSWRELATGATVRLSQGSRVKISRIVVIDLPKCVTASLHEHGPSSNLSLSYEQLER